MAEYGEEVLADPGTGGFNLTLWLVPIVIVLLAAVGHRRRVQTLARARLKTEAELPPPLSPEDARRLDAELGT